MTIKIFIVLFSILFLASCASSLKLPSDFRKCNATTPDFDECLSEAIGDAIKQLKEPKDKYGLPGFEPFQAPKDVILEYGDPVNGVRVSESNFRVSGLTGITKTRASMDFETNTLKLDLTFDEIQCVVDYEAHGKFLYLPINAASTETFTLEKPTIKFIFKFGEYLKGDKRHYVILKAAMSVEPESIKYFYDKLFENPELNELINQEISTHWKEFFKHVGPPKEELFAHWFTKAFSNLLEKVPIEELFDGLPEKVLRWAYLFSPYYVPQQLI